MDNFRMVGKELDFPVYNNEVKKWFSKLLVKRQIPFRWHDTKDTVYMGFFRIKFVTTGELFSFFFEMGEKFGIRKDATQSEVSANG